MVEDFKQFLKFYRMYKKGKREMDKIKEFVSSHKKEIAMTACGFIIFRVGYNSGWNAYKRVVNNVFNTMKKHGYQTVRLIEPTGGK